jgi:hypothetical protein
MITPEELVEVRVVVEQYQDALPDMVRDAVEAGAFEDCALAVHRLLPHLREGGTERLAILAAVALIRLAQSWQREGVAL